MDTNFWVASFLKSLTISALYVFFTNPDVCDGPRGLPHTHPTPRAVDQRARSRNGIMRKQAITRLLCAQSLDVFDLRVCELRRAPRRRSRINQGCLHGLATAPRSLNRCRRCRWRQLRGRQSVRPWWSSSRQQVLRPSQPSLPCQPCRRSVRVRKRNVWSRAHATRIHANRGSTRCRNPWQRRLFQLHRPRFWAMAHR